MIEHHNNTPTVTLLRRTLVQARTGLSRSSLYAKIKAGDFPKPVYLTPVTPAWIAAEVDGWIASLVAQRNAKQVLAI